MPSPGGGARVQGGRGWAVPSRRRRGWTERGGRGFAPADTPQNARRSLSRAVRGVGRRPPLTVARLVPSPVAAAPAAPHVGQEPKPRGLGARREPQIVAPPLRLRLPARHQIAHLHGEPAGVVAHHGDVDVDRLTGAVGRADGAGRGVAGGIKPVAAAAAAAGGEAEPAVVGNDACACARVGLVRRVRSSGGSAASIAKPTPTKPGVQQARHAPPMLSSWGLYSSCRR